MRKRIIGSSLQEEPKGSAVQDWLDIEKISEVEVSSEDEAHPVESALLPGSASGWRAAGPGRQRIRLVFDSPQEIELIVLKFSEPGIGRTQEYVLRWSIDGGRFQEIVRQQWNFSPEGSATEIEHHHVALSRVKALELDIIPDIGGGSSFATLDELRIS